MAGVTFARLPPPLIALFQDRRRGRAVDLQWHEVMLAPQRQAIFSESAMLWKLLSAMTETPAARSRARKSYSRAMLARPNSCDPA